MPEPEDTVIEDQKTPTVTPTLDQIHAISQAKVEEEDENDATTIDEDSTEGDDSDEDVSTDTGDTDAEEDTSTDVKEDVLDERPASRTADIAESTTELDEDITQKGKDKVAVKDINGTTFYFNNLSQVPKDFEPVSYAEMMVATGQLIRKEDRDIKAAEDAQTRAQQEAHAEATTKLQEAWEIDAGKLVNAGALPKDPTKLEAAKAEVYDYIEKEMKDGNIITSFTQAFKGLQYDKQQEAQAKKQKDLNDAKKKRGSIVQGGGGGGDTDGPSRRTKVIEAPPSGVGLDRIHQRALESL